MTGPAPRPEADGAASTASVRRHVVVTGGVQGVTFRESTRRRAEGSGVAGWVRNLPDGSVEAELEGPDRAVHEVLAWMRTGPRQARVERLDVTPVATRGERSFSVR